MTNNKKRKERPKDGDRELCFTTSAHPYWYNTDTYIDICTYLFAWTCMAETSTLSRQVAFSRKARVCCLQLLPIWALSAIFEPTGQNSRPTGGKPRRATYGPRAFLTCIPGRLIYIYICIYIVSMSVSFCIYTYMCI